jgi:hypothetical protein
MEILHKKLDNTIETYIVTIDTDMGKMEMEVQVQDDETVIEHIETRNTDIWNKLSFEDKNEIDEMLTEEFS